MHNLGLKADGSILAWGSNSAGQTNVPAPNTGFLDVAAGYEHSLALRLDGSIVGWGRNSEGQTSVPSPNTGFVDVTAGAYHSLGLKSNGTIVAWGFDCCGGTNVPAPNSDFVSIAAGLDFSLGLRGDGSIVAWGRNEYGQTNVPAPNPISSLSPRARRTASQSDGGLVLAAICLPERARRMCQTTTVLELIEHGLMVRAAFTSRATLSRVRAGTQQTWTKGATCAHVQCAAVTGACCDRDPFGTCVDGVTHAACECPTCEWVKLGSCSELDCPHAAIPTAGVWGLAILSLLILTGAKVAFGRSRPAELNKA